MIEVPILNLENQTVIFGERKVLTNNAVSDTSSHEGDFNQQLQKYQQKNSKNFVDEAIDLKQEMEAVTYLPDEIKLAFITQPLLLQQVDTASETEQEITGNIMPVLNNEAVSEHMTEAMDNTVQTILHDNSIMTDMEIEEKTLLQEAEIITAEIPAVSAVIPKTNIDLQNTQNAQNTQNVEAGEQIDPQQILNSMEEADENGKSISVKNVIQTTKEISEVDQDKIKIIAEQGQNDKPTAKNDQNDVKKLMDFETNRMKASKLSDIDETSKQETGSDLQDMTDKTSLTELKLRNTEGNFQNKFPNSISTKDVIEQIVEKVELIQGKKVSEIEIELKPEFLGKMTVKLVMEEGGLTAKFVTDNLQTKQLLENNLNSLRLTLEDHGIKVEKTEVNVQLNNGGMFDGSEGNQQDKWQNQVYEPYRLEYIEEIASGDEHLDNMETNAQDYMGVDMVKEGSMNFLV